MIHRRTFVAGMIATFAAPVAGWPEQARKTPRIGVLQWGATTSEEPLLREAFRDLGYIDAQNFTLDWRSAAEKRELATKHAAEFARLPVDVVVALATPAAQAAQDATHTIPIVIVAADPVRFGLVQSLARPGGNITGVSVNLPALAGKRLELLRHVLPRLTRVAFLASNAEGSSAALFVNETQAAARRLGDIHVQVVAIHAASDFESAFSAMVREVAGALIVQPIFTSHSSRISELATKHRLPSISDYSDFAAAGGLMSYGPSVKVFVHSVAIYVDRILKGAQPRDLPIEEPTAFELVINLKTAKALGLTIPPSLLLRADQVIE